MFEGLVPSDGILVRSVSLALALAAGFIFAKFANFGIKKTAKHFVQKTETILDDLLLDALDLPITIGITLAVFYAAIIFSGLNQPILDTALREAVILLGAFTLYKIIGALLHWYAVEVAPTKNLSMGGMEKTAGRIAGFVIFSVAVIMALDTAGVEVTPLVASLGIAGLAVALAFQDTLSNFFAGVYISIDRPFKEGDYILLDSGQEGYITKIGWRSTKIKMLANNTIIVPNSKLASSIIVNYYSPDREMGITVPVSVSYESDLARVEKVTVEVAAETLKSTTGAVKDFKPFIRYTAFADSGINFNVILRVGEYADKFLVTHEFIKALHARYAKEGIEIPYPKRHVYVEQIGKKGKPNL